VGQISLGWFLLFLQFFSPVSQVFSKYETLDGAWFQGLSNEVQHGGMHRQDFTHPRQLS
jgi:hypothetical protein